MDQAVQSDATAVDIGGDEMPQLSAAEDMGGMPQVGDLLTEQSFVDDQTEMSESTLVQEAAVPMHLSVSSDTQFATSTSTTTITQTSQSDSNGAPTDDVQVKLEPSDVIDTGQGIVETETKMEETETTDFLNQQQVGASGSIQMFGQSPGGTGGISTRHYQVPISPKPYQCGVCHKAFRSVQVLQKHMQTFHSRPQVKLTPRRGRGRGSHYLNRPSHQQAPPRTSTYPVFPGGESIEQTPPKQLFQDIQDIPGTSSQQIAQMAQLASFAQPQSTPIAVTPSTSDFTQSPSVFQSPAPGPSTSSTPAQQGQSTGRVSVLVLVSESLKSNNL